MNTMNIKDYLHLYLGCEVQTEKGTATLVSVGMLGSDLQSFRTIMPGMSVTRGWEETNTIILRRFKNITEIECKELFTLIFGRKFPDTGRILWFKEKTTSSDPRWVLWSGVDRVGIEMNGHVWADCDLSNYKHNQHAVTLWCLSKNFDLFNLIPEGLAIDKKIPA